jgi:hypothetical protein
MTIAELIAMPTTLDTGRDHYHESLFRSYHILQRALELLDAGVAPEPLAAILRELLDFPHVTLDRKET